MRTIDGRNAIIDAFRGIAILSVMAFHYSVRWAPPLQASNVYGYREQFPSVLTIGHLGVHLFFVISGLVITMTVLRSRDAFDFCTRRFARLYPAFLVGLGLTFAVGAFAGVPEFRTSVADAIVNLSMDAPDLHHRMVDGAYWSLAVEVKFYALVAVSFAVLRDRFWIAVAGFGILGGVATVIGDAAHASKFMIAGYMPLFIAGMGAWFGFFEGLMRRALILFAVAAVLYVVASRGYAAFGESSWLVQVYLVGLVSLLFLLLASARDLTVPLLPWIGRISYSLYLIHQDVGVIMIRHLAAWGLPDLLAAALAAAICIAVAWLMFKLVEQPGKRAVMLICGDSNRTTRGTHMAPLTSIYPSAD